MIEKLTIGGLYRKTLTRKSLNNSFNSVGCLDESRKMMSGLNSVLRAQKLNFRRATRCALVTLTGLFTACAPQLKHESSIPEVPSPAFAKLIDETVKNSMREEHLPGVAVVIVKEGKTLFKQGYGVADLSTERPVNPDTTVFRIGSITKALTSLAIARMADQQRIRLSDSIAQYYPNHRPAPDVDEPVKIEHLITHTAGFDQIGVGRQVAALELPLEDRKALREDLETFLANNNLRHLTQPGLNYRYDTYGITLAGTLIAKVTGRTYAQAMKTELFDPIGMKRSFVEVEAEYEKDLAVGYGYVQGQYLAAPYEVYVTTPASSVDTTANDMALLLQALTSDGRNQIGRLFSPEMTRRILSPQFRPHPEFPGVSHGLKERFKVYTKGKGPIREIGHGGSMLGFSANLALFPESNLGVFVVANRDAEAGGGRVSVFQKVMSALLSQMEYSTRSFKPKRSKDVKDWRFDDYVGHYYYGVFCRTCSQAEFAAGGWRQGSAIKVTNAEDALELRGKRYYPSTENDVFVDESGTGAVFFGRNQRGEVSFFTYNRSPDTFEKY